MCQSVEEDLEANLVYEALGFVLGCTVQQPHFGEREALEKKIFRLECCLLRRKRGAK